MSTPAVEISLSDLARNFGNAAARVDYHLGQMRAEIAKSIMAEMLRLVARATGHLASRIVIKHSPDRTEIGPEGVEYAPYVEYGTASRSEFGGSAYEITPKDAHGVLTFQVQGKTVFAKSVLHPGIYPQPYARPAAERWLNQMGLDAGAIGVKLITGEIK